MDGLDELVDAYNKGMKSNGPHDFGLDRDELIKFLDEITSQPWFGPLGQAGSMTLGICVGIQLQRDREEKRVENGT